MSRVIAVCEMKAGNHAYCACPHFSLAARCACAEWRRGEIFRRRARRDGHVIEGIAK
jgi:hypothetical protein